MYEKIRAEIIDLFGVFTSLPEHGILLQLERRGVTDHHQVYKTIHAMKDKGELVPYGIDSLRLSIKAAEADLPLNQKTTNYLIQHWISIAALLLSLVALFK